MNILVTTERVMPRSVFACLAALVLVPALVAAQDTTRHYQHGGAIDSNRIGIMTPLVVQQRLRLLGYTDVSVVESARMTVRANASKSGRIVAVRLDPHSGKVTEVSGRLERRPEGLRLIRPNGTVVAPPL
jgi:hypothetical protein